MMRRFFIVHARNHNVKSHSQMVRCILLTNSQLLPPFGALVQLTDGPDGDVAVRVDPHGTVFSETWGEQMAPAARPLHEGVSSEFGLDDVGGPDRCLTVRGVHSTRGTA